MSARRTVASALGEVELADTGPGGIAEDVRCVPGPAAERGMMISDQRSYRARRRARRNTRRWCRGKVGRQHAFVLLETLGENFGLPALHVWACRRCGCKMYNPKASHHHDAV